MNTLGDRKMKDEFALQAVRQILSIFDLAIWL